MTWQRDGYHGTSTDYATSIISSGRFRPSLGEEEWLGEGIYFFQYCGDAHWWCSGVKKLRRYTILTARISADVSRVIDLNDPEDWGNFITVRKNILGRYKKLSNGYPRKVFDSVVIKAMKNCKPADVVVGSFNTNRAVAPADCNAHSGQIQICVSNHDCIEGIRAYLEV